MGVKALGEITQPSATAAPQGGFTMAADRIVCLSYIAQDSVIYNKV